LAAGLAGLDEQPAASTASRARPASDRFRVSDMTVSLLLVDLPVGGRRYSYVHGRDDLPVRLAA